MSTSPSARPDKRMVVSLASLALAVVVLWQFPGFWYADPNPGLDYRWFGERTNLAGWTYREVPVSKAAESVIQADSMVNGTFETGDGRAVQVYSAKRYLKKENEIGLFSHTPDRCWTSVGWKIILLQPDVTEVDVHGVRMLLERRLFVHGAERVLVYFGAVVGGKPLPYRLDQYHSSGARAEAEIEESRRTWRRLAQLRVWSWAWDSFVQRTPLAGPQQFVRLSTPDGGDLKAADALLTQILGEWLQLVDYRTELQCWESRRKQPVATPPNPVVAPR